MKNGASFNNRSQGFGYSRALLFTKQQVSECEVQLREVSLSDLITNCLVYNMGTNTILIMGRFNTDIQNVTPYSQ